MWVTSFLLWVPLILSYDLAASQSLPSDVCDVASSRDVWVTSFLSGFSYVIPVVVIVVLAFHSFRLLLAMKRPQKKTTTSFYTLQPSVTTEEDGSSFAVDKSGSYDSPGEPAEPPGQTISSTSSESDNPTAKHLLKTCCKLGGTTRKCNKNPLRVSTVSLIPACHSASKTLLNNYHRENIQKKLINSCHSENVQQPAINSSPNQKTPNTPTKHRTASKTSRTDLHVATISSEVKRACKKKYQHLDDYHRIATFNVVIAAAFIVTVCPYGVVSMVKAACGDCVPPGRCISGL